MREIKIKVHSNKKMTCLNGSFTCKKGENKIDVLVFDVDENLLQYNNFIILKSPNGTTYIDIVLNDMTYSIGSFITNELGNWTIQFLSSTQEDIVSEEEIDETQTIMISDSLSFNVIDSLASGELVLPPTSSNLDLLGEQLANIYNTLSVVIEEYPEVENYIELQEELLKIEDMISNIKIDVGEVTIDNTEVLNAIDEVKEDIANINVDLSPISSKLDDLSDNVANIPTNDYSANLEQIQSDTTQIKGRVSSVQSMIESVLISNTNAIKSNTEYTQESVETIKNRIGNDDTKADGTLFNYSYWGLVRAEEAKTIGQQILLKISDVNNLVDDILE